VEACDPCEASEFAYTINGVLVSDFITPHFYDPRRRTGARYSFTGSITQPRGVLPDGYISWWDPPSNHVWQLTWFGGAEPELVDLGSGGFSNGELSLREFVDRRTDHPGIDHGLDQENESLTDARQAWQGANRAADALGTGLEEEIRRLLSDEAG
jgi:hypothetical protein